MHNLKTGLDRCIIRKPRIIEDEIGYKQVAPDAGRMAQPDMSPDFTKRLRAKLVAHARFIDDVVTAQRKHSIDQYVMGAGLDTFAQRRPAIASLLQVFEIDQPDT